MSHTKSKTVKALNNKIIEASHYLSTMLPFGWFAALIIDDLDKNTYELSFSDKEKTISLETTFLAKLVPVELNGEKMVRIERLSPRQTRKILNDALLGRIYYNTYFHADMIEYHVDDGLD